MKAARIVLEIPLPDEAEPADARVLAEGIGMLALGPPDMELQLRQGGRGPRPFGYVTEAELVEDWTTPATIIAQP